MTTLTKAQEAERQEAITVLRDWLPPGTTVYTVLESVSRSGMQRSIVPYALVNGEMQYLGFVGRVLGCRRSKHHDGFIIGGCGMDMGFHLAYNLGRVLYPDGFDCIGKDCPSNDHSNRETRTHHTDGGYALRHRWL